MSSKTLHHVLIDSRDRDEVAYPQPNRYRVNLPKRYQNVTSARLLSISLPMSFYVFSEAQGNTELFVSVGDSGWQRVLIPDGNYDPCAMAETLKVVLIDTFPSNTFEVGVDKYNLRLMIRCLEDLPVAVRVPETDTSGHDRSLAYLLGFRGGEDGSSGYLIASAVINTNPWLYIVLDIDELATIDEGALGGNAVGKGCFAHISLPAHNFEYMFKDDLKIPAVQQCPPIPKLERLTVTFRTHDGKVLDFQGIDHNFVIELVTREPRPPPSAPVNLAPQEAAAPRPAARQVQHTVVLPPALPPPSASSRHRWNIMVVVAVLACVGGGWYVYRRRVRQ